jgi:hypothetical protein
MLPVTTRIAHHIPDFRHSLLSIGVLCDHGCIALFSANHVYIIYNKAVILEGTRTSPGLWTVDLPSTQHNTSQSTTVLPIKPNCNDLEEITFYMANKVVHSTTMRDHILFLHAACFSPTLETWLLAISCGHFITWPGLTTANVRRYLPKSEATAKGHLDQQRKNLRSTKQNPLSR